MDISSIKGEYDYFGIRRKNGSVMKRNENRTRRTSGKKYMVLVLALLLAVGGVVSGTLAWLVDSAGPVENIFTRSDIDVKLSENQKNFQMIPGWTIAKDPVITLSEDSEDCYLFVKVEESGGTETYPFDAFIAYAIGGNWKQLEKGENDPVSGVYYCVIDSDEKRYDSVEKKPVEYHVLGAGRYKDTSGVEYTWNQDEVLTKPEVTKAMMDAVKDQEPKLTFTAYAVQLWKSNKPGGDSSEGIVAAQFTPYEAWQKANPAE